MKFKHKKETSTIWVNARFLSRPVTGVERVARELLGALASRFLDQDGGWQARGHRYELKLVAPTSCKADSPWPNLPLVRAGIFGGHLWEQIDLPRLSKGDWLLNLCNTGPLLKRRQILYLHDPQPIVMPDNFTFAFRAWYRLLLHVAGHSAAHVLVNSHFTRLELQRYVGLHTNKLRVCYPGSEHVARDSASACELTRFDLPDEPFLLAVASANPNKNFAAVVRALALLGDEAPPCVIVGRTDQRQFGNVELDNSRITHLGYVSDDELLALYRRAMALVFPSFYEGFGLPPVEAMAAGCPVIASHTSAMPEVVGTAVEYCDPHDHRTLAEAISRIARCPERRAGMIASGLRRARSFSWSESGEQLRRIITEAVGNTG